MRPGRGELGDSERAELERLRALEQRMRRLAGTVAHRRVGWVGRIEFERALNGDADTAPRQKTPSDPPAPSHVRGQPIADTPWTGDLS